MPKSRPATWLEKEMMLNLIKKSGKKLDVDLDKCDYIRSSAGNLVCKYIGRIKKIKKKSIIIDDIMINREPVNIESMKVKLDDIKPYSCQYVSVD